MKVVRVMFFTVMVSQFLLFSICFAQNYDKGLIEFGISHASKSGYNLLAFYKREQGDIFLIHGSAGIGGGGINLKENDMVLNAGYQSFKFNKFDLNPCEFLVMKSGSLEKSKKILQAKLITLQQDAKCLSGGIHYLSEASFEEFTRRN